MGLMGRVVPTRVGSRIAYRKYKNPDLVYYALRNG